MPLKSELLRFLSRIPNVQTVPQRKAVLAAVGLDRLGRQITWEGANLVFFNELLELLVSEGQVNLESFLKDLADRDLALVGLEDSQRLLTFAEHVGSLTANEWNREFLGATDTQTTSHIPFILPQLDVLTFTGREEQLHRLEGLLLDPDGQKVCSIVGLSGGGGIGKSALACHFATIYRDKFPDGVIGLRVDGKDVDTIARDFARRCGEVLDPEDERDAATLMQEVFAHRQMLLIFDNAVDANIRKLRPGGSQCAVIITTRNRTLSSSLDIPNEGAIDLNPLPEEDSLKLLKKILQDDRVDAELPSAYEIIRLLGNLPLALQIAGAALRRQRLRCIGDYVASLQREKTRLAKLKIRGDDELNVEASINLSLELLDENEHDFFSCLSVCAEDGFARRTAMAAGDCEDEWETDDYLIRLYDLSLLNYAKTGENRFVLHPLVQVYAKSIARKRNLFSIAQERHAQFFVGWLQSNELTDEGTIAEVAANLDDVILATRWLQEHEAETAQGKLKSYKFVLKLHPLFEQYRYWRKAIKLMARFQSWAEQLQDWNAVVKYKMHEARYWSFVENWERAEEALKSARQSLEKIENLSTRKGHEAKLLNVLGGIFQKQNRLQEAIETFREESLIVEEIEDKRSLAIVCNRIGKLLQAQNNLEEAQQSFEQCISVAKTIHDQLTLAFGLNCLGGVLQQQGKLEEAHEILEQEITIAEAQNDQRRIVIGLNRLGGVLQQQGKLDEAHQTFKRQLEIAESQNDQSSLAIGLNCLGGVLQQQGKLEDAQQTFERQIEIAEAQNDQFTLAIGLHQLGRIWKIKGEFEKAEMALKQSQEIFEDEKNLRSLAKVMNTLGGVLEKQQKWDEAERILRQSYDLAAKLKDKRGQAIITNSLGQVKARQEGEEAFEISQMFFRQSIKLGEELDDQKHLAKVHTAFGQFFSRRELFEQAVKHLNQGFEIDERESNLRGLKIVTPNLTYAFLKLGKRQKALDYCKRALRIAPNYSGFLELYDKIQSSIAIGSQQVFIKTGSILFISKRDNFRWGRILPDDRSQHITFSEKYVGSEIFNTLVQGALVEVEVYERHEKLYAKKIRIIEDDEDNLSDSVVIITKNNNPIRAD